MLTSILFNGGITTAVAEEFTGITIMAKPHIRSLKPWYVTREHGVDKATYTLETLTTIRTLTAK